MPGALIALTVLMLNLLGNGVRRALDPYARPARVREADMIRFAVRRLASMVLVLFAVSVLVFLIFNAIPGGDPGGADRRRARQRHPARGDPP